MPPLYIAAITHKRDKTLAQTLIADSAHSLYVALRNSLIGDAPAPHIKSLHDILAAVDDHPLLNSVAISISTDHDALRTEPGIVLLDSLGNPSPINNGIPTILSNGLAYAAEQADDDDEECLLLDDATPATPSCQPIATLPAIAYARLTPHNADNILAKPIGERISYIAPLIFHLTNQSVTAEITPTDTASIRSLGVIAIPSGGNTSTCMIVSHHEDDTITPIMTISGVESEEQKIMIFQIVNLISTGQPHR